VASKKIETHNFHPPYHGKDFVVYCIGWLGVLNIIWWLSIAIAYYGKSEGTFIERTRSAIHIWGWIFIVIWFLLLCAFVMSILKTGF